MKPTLSKSQYIKGLQCPKNLWFYRYRKDLATPVDAATQARFDAGNMIGQLAMEYFAPKHISAKHPHKSVEITNDYWDISGGIANTQQHVQDGTDIIYEATAMHPANGCYSRMDILQKDPTTQRWNLIEVKSSTAVKDYHLDDMAFQYYVFHHAGYDIDRCYMMVINNSYVKHGAIDARGLFRLQDITDEISANIQQVEARAPEMISMLNDKNNEPDVTISNHCNTPFVCDYKHHCWRDVPDYNIFSVYHKAKVNDIYQATSSYKIEDVPAKLYPKGRKAIDMACHKRQDIHIEKANLKQWLTGLSYPLYYLDYETIVPPVPLFDGTKPFQQIPFQFSLHVMENRHATPQHFEFIHQQQTDPRAEFVKNLLAVCGTAGSVVVYNQSFEQGRNLELARDFPEYASGLQAINARMVDLLVPFRKRLLYRYMQQGSASIKAVLPAFTDLSYDDMAIGNGGDAMQAYLRYMNGAIKPAEQQQLFDDLLRYCQLDTLAMVELMKIIHLYALYFNGDDEGRYDDIEGG